MKDITMNDSEIKDIDKLKKLLIEFGVDFKEFNYEEIDCIDLIQQERSLDNYFVFNKDGSFNHIRD